MLLKQPSPSFKERKKKHFEDAKNAHTSSTDHYSKPKVDCIQKVVEGV